MKKALTWAKSHVVLIVLALALVIVVAVRSNELYIPQDRTTMMVGMVYDPSVESERVRKAYDAVLEEEGIPHRWVDYKNLILENGQDQLAAWQVLVFPDSCLRYLPLEMASRAQQFAERGGKVMVVYDAGVRNARAAYRKQGVFADLLGVDYLRYEKLKEKAYSTSWIQFGSAADAAFWQIPPGKLDDEHAISGYGYGRLTYPVAATEVIGNTTVYAWSQLGPVLSVRKIGKGEAAWVGLPLSALKGGGDDLPMRAVLRTFIDQISEVPHLVPAPAGVGGLVIDFHVDANTEFIGLPAMMSAGLLRPGLRYEFDVTAGPDDHVPGDDQGFEAEGRGRDLLLSLMHYGTIGSHGGWAHDWYAENVENGTLSREEAKEYVEANNKALERVTGQRILSYAAPKGVYPQPWMTHILDSLGMTSYYYTGDSGSPPNRTFYEGRMVSNRVWAFPIMPNYDTASFYEMKVLNEMSDEKIGRWLHGTLDYVIRNRTVRLVYSHPHDLNMEGLQRVFSTFLDEVEAAQKKGELTVEAMPLYTDFFRRFVRTRMIFEQVGGRFLVDLSNPEGLKDICVAIPTRLLSDRLNVPAGVEVRVDGKFQLLTVRSDARRLELDLEAR